MTMTVLSLLFSVALTGLLLAATVCDLTRFRIPNPIPAAVAGLFLLKVALGLGIGPLLPHLLVAALALSLGFLAFALGLLGGGDAKLMAALALWFGPSAFAEFIIITGIAGGFFALLLLLIRRPGAAVAMASDGSSPWSRQHRLLDPKAPVPYALPIAFAALWLEWF